MHPPTDIGHKRKRFAASRSRRQSRRKRLRCQGGQLLHRAFLLVACLLLLLVLCRRPYFEAEEVGFARQEPQQSDWVPYYEAEEVGHTPRPRREPASEVPRQTGWVPNYEAAEVGNTQRGRREQASEEPQQYGWVLPSLPFAAFAGFASAAAWSSAADDTTTEDLPSSEVHLRA